MRNFDGGKKSVFDERIGRELGVTLIEGNRETVHRDYWAHKIVVNCCEEIEEAEGSVSGESAAAQGRRRETIREDIAEEVHAEDDAGKRDAEREKTSAFERGGRNR